MDECARLHYQREADLNKRRAGLFTSNVSTEAETEIRARIEGVNLENDTMRDELHLIEARCLAGEIDALEMERQISSLQARDKRLYEVRGARLSASTFAPVRRTLVTQRRDCCCITLLARRTQQPEEYFHPRVLDYADQAGRVVGLQQLLMQAA